MRMAKRVASRMDPKWFGVQAMYIFGGVRSAFAGPDSDLDLIVHFTGDEQQKRELESWLDGWSMALAESNYLRTGCPRERLLDVRLVTDEDIRKQTPFAAKIGAVTDAAVELPLGGG
jgi:hypothetical protein